MMKKIILCFVLFFMLAACGEKTNFQGKYEEIETKGELWLVLEKVNDVDYKATTKCYGKKCIHAVKIKNSNQLFDSKETYLGEFKENKDFVDKRGKVYKKVE